MNKYYSNIIYKKGAVTIYRLFSNIGLMTFSGKITFNDGTVIGNVYKYYNANFTVVEGYNFMELNELISMWTPFMLHLTNSSHHTFASLSYHGIVQMTGDGTWDASGYGIVMLRI